MRENALMQFKTFKSKGEYNKIQIEYDAILEGDIDAMSLQSNGSSKIRGNLKALTLELRGLSDIVGNCKCGDGEIIGESKIKGNFRARKLNLNGTLNLEGKIKINELILNGILNNDNYLECEKITGSGLISTNKIISKEIDIALSNKSEISSIVGNDINLRGKETGLFTKLKRKKIFIKEIQGDKIKLENIKANLVIGKEVLLGDGCEIKEIKEL